MARPVRSPQAQVIQVSKELKLFTEKGIKMLALEAHSVLVSEPSEGGTPVDTGWARANWIGSIGSPPSGNVADGATSNTSDQAESGNVSGAAAQEGLARIVAFYKVEQGAVYMSNGVPYINRLNAGWSKQAGAGFVQRAILKAVKNVEARL